MMLTQDEFKTQMNLNLEKLKARAKNVQGFYNFLVPYKRKNIDVHLKNAIHDISVLKGEHMSISIDKKGNFVRLYNKADNIEFFTPEFTIQQLKEKVVQVMLDLNSEVIQLKAECKKVNKMYNTHAGLRDGMWILKDGLSDCAFSLLEGLSDYKLTK